MMTRNRLDLIKNEELEFLENQLKDVLTFKNSQEFEKFAKLLTDIDEFINSEKIQDIDECVLLPMQRLVEVSLMIKGYEEQEIKRDLHSKGIFDVSEFKTLKRIFIDVHNDYFLDRWEIDLNDCLLEDLRKTSKILLYETEKHFSQIIKLLNENQFLRLDIIANYNCDLPLPINILFNALHCFWIKINDLIAQFHTIQETFNIMYSPIKVDHYLNDKEIIPVSCLKNLIEVVTDSLLDRQDKFNIDDMNEILNELYIYPTYHKWTYRIEREIAELKDIKYQKIFDSFNSFKKQQLFNVYDEEFSNLSSFKEIKEIDIEVKEEVFSCLGTNITDLHRYKSLRVDKKLPDVVQPTRIYVRSDLILSTQYKVLDLMKDLIMNNMMQEAELIYRCYLLLTNRINFNEYNHAERYFQRWIDAEVYIQQFLLKLAQKNLKVLSSSTSI